MESQPQNPEFRNNPENFHPCLSLLFQCGVVRQNNDIAITHHLELII